MIDSTTARELLRLARVAAGRFASSWGQREELAQDTVERLLRLRARGVLTESDHLLAAVWRTTRWRWLHVRARERGQARHPGGQWGYRQISLGDWDGPDLTETDELVDVVRALRELQESSPHDFEALVEQEPGPGENRARRWLCGRLGLQWAPSTGHGRLTAESAQAMREMWASDELTYRELGERFGVHTTVAWKVIAGQIWRAA